MTSGMMTQITRRILVGPELSKCLPYWEYSSVPYLLKSHIPQQGRVFVDSWGITLSLNWCCDITLQAVRPWLTLSLCGEECGCCRMEMKPRRTPMTWPWAPALDGVVSPAQPVPWVSTQDGQLGFFLFYFFFFPLGKVALPLIYFLFGILCYKKPTQEHPWQVIHKKVTWGK